MLVVTFCQLIQLLVLARLFSPHEFGIASIILIYIGFSQTFIDGGLSNAIIQKQSTTLEQLSSLFWFGVVIGAALSISTFIIAPSIAVFFKYQPFSDFIRLISPTFVISSFGIHFRALYEKNITFAIPCIVDITTTIIQTVATLTFAIMGLGAISIVYGFLIRSLLASVALVYFGCKFHYVPSFVLNIHKIKSHIQFGLFELGNKSINYFSANIDKLLIGKMIGMQSVGIYNLAWQFVIFPVTKLIPIINKVALPIYSRQSSHPEVMARSYSYTIRLSSFVTIPALTFLSFNSHELIQIIYGDFWKQTADVISVLAYLAMFKVIANPGGTLLLALGRADLCFWWNLVWSLVVLMFLYIVLYQIPNIEVIAPTLLVLSMTIGMLWHVMIFKVSKVNYWPIIKYLVWCFLIAHVSAFIVGLIVNKFTMASSPTILLVKLILFVSTYSFISFVFRASLNLSHSLKR